jgi:hypothetical protein
MILIFVVYSLALTQKRLNQNTGLGILIKNKIIGGYLKWLLESLV